MPVLDLASSDRKLPVEIAVCPAAELLLLVVAAGMDDRSEFEIGDERLCELIDTSEPATRERLDWMAATDEKMAVNLLALLLDVGLTAEIPALLERLRETDPDRLLALLTGDDGPSPALAERDPAEVKSDLIALLSEWAELAGDLVGEGLPAMERDAQARRRRAESATADELVEEATNGVKLSRHPGLEKVVLLPSYVFRPWVLLSEHEGVRIICYPVADEFVEQESAAPPPRLVKLFKALGDEGRLRMLRRLSAGPASLSDAAELLDVAKSTAHHHLAILRQAGLVLVDPDDGTYSLRQQLVPEATELLQRYLDPDSG